MRVGFIGCVNSSAVALQALLDMPQDLVEVVGLITRRASTFNADFHDLAPIALQHQLPVLLQEDAPEDSDQAAWLGALAPDLVFCVGWSRLLGPRVLGVAPRGVVGYHPAALPANRGRHPLIWALALGLDETASSFFMMRADADSGAIVHQHRIVIAAAADAATLYAQVLAAIPMQLGLIVRGLADGSLQPRPQDESLANHWRKRSAADGRIDWRMTASSVNNLVRALARPYPGADILCGGQTVKIWRCAVVDAGRPNDEPGKVLAVDGREVTVKCGLGSVRLTEHDFVSLPLKGSYL